MFFYSFSYTYSLTLAKPIQTTVDPALPRWTQDASLLFPRSNFDAALLANGQVIAVGGRVNQFTIVKNSEVYSPSTGWTQSVVMQDPRFAHAVTPFAGNTKILATGSAYAPYERTAEIYDLATNTWASTQSNLISGRFGHGAVRLENDQILIFGGQNSRGYILDNTEVYSPSTDTFTAVNSMQTSRTLFSNTLLNDGSTVFVTGGGDQRLRMLSTAELYMSGAWIYTNGPMIQPRAYHASVLLQDGTVLIAGGGNGAFISYKTAEIYNPTTGNFTAVRSMKYARAAFTLTLLPSGKVLAAGGVDWSTQNYPTVCELYDPVTKTWSDTHVLNTGRRLHRSILVNQSVLTMGGYDSRRQQTNTCEKYTF